MPLKTYDESIGVLRRALDTARLDGGEKIAGMQRLHQFTLAVERRLQTTVDLDAVVRHEFEISPALDGRSVLDDKPARQRKILPHEKQLRLF